MYLNDLSLARVERELERLFKENPPVYGRLCRNPVTEGWYIGGLDPTRVQKNLARRPLLAREWFRSHGPADAQPLPISMSEREALKGRGLLLHILSWYARSLEGVKYDVEVHPSFADYVSGVLWEAERPADGFVGLPNYDVEQFQELKKRYPPRMLKGMSPGAYWLPPKEHARATAGLRRRSPNPDACLARA